MLRSGLLKVSETHTDYRILSGPLVTDRLEVLIRLLDGMLFEGFTFTERNIVVARDSNLSQVASDTSDDS